MSLKMDGESLDAVLSSTNTNVCIALSIYGSSFHFKKWHSNQICCPQGNISSNQNVKVDQSSSVPRWVFRRLNICLYTRMISCLVKVWSWNINQIARATLTLQFSPQFPLSFKYDLGKVVGHVSNLSSDVKHNLRKRSPHWLEKTHF